MGQTNHPSWVKIPRARYPSFLPDTEPAKTRVGQDERASYRVNPKNSGAVPPLHQSKLDASEVGAQLVASPYLADQDYKRPAENEWEIEN